MARAQSFRVPSLAMAPTLRLGEYVTAVLDTEYAPQVGDIIVFHPPTAAEAPAPTCANLE